MNNEISLKVYRTRIVVIDILLLITVFLIPSLSHLSAIPLFYFEPMRWLLLGGIVFTNSKWNALLLSVFLPVVSFLISSHPIFIKSAMMSVELTLNVILFFEFKNLGINHFGSFLISILLSKLFYYIVKFTLMYYGIAFTKLITTPLYIQCINVFLMTIFYYIISKHNNYGCSN